MNRIIIVIKTLFLIACSTIQAQNDCPMPIGTNLSWLADGGVYKNLKLTSSHFYTRNAIYLEDGNDWDSGLASTMLQDEAGYPLAVPFTHPVTGQDQVIAFTVGGHSLNYETGDYILLYDGVGTFHFANWTSQTVTSITPGRIEFTINEVNENGVHIEVTSSQNGNHVRNIRIVRAIYENDYLTDPFLPQFAEKLTNFSAVRFMDWSHTNYNETSSWAERTLPVWHTQELEYRGCAWEKIIELCNYFGLAPWINVPHLADAGYVDSMAVLFRDMLDPELDIYLEYTNEGWNWIFEQTYWLDSIQPYPGNPGRNYGHYSNIVFTKWHDAFAGQESRVQTVLAGHDYFVLEALDYLDAQGTTHLVDLVSYPGYVGLNETDYDTLSAYGAASTPELVLELLHANKAENFYWMQQFKTLVSEAYNKPFVMYEGGQHLTPQWFGLDTSYNQALYDAQLHPGMYSFYQDLLGYCKDSLGVSLFMNYTLSSPQESSFGSWGLLDNNFLTAPWPVKYQSVLDFIANCGPVVTPEIQADQHDISIYPNPSEQYIYINGALSNYTIQVLDTSGAIYQNLSGAGNSLAINISMLPAGTYFIRLQHLDYPDLYVEKLIKL